VEPLLSVVVPCFNEEAALPAFLSEAIESINTGHRAAPGKLFLSMTAAAMGSAAIILEQHCLDSAEIYR
jgi:hypothetical protein